MAKTKQKKDSGKLYSKEELECIRDYMKVNGEFHDYETANLYAPYHFEKTGKERSGHALYMCAWRILDGRYDSII
ncbi:hypothetical protein LMG7974_01066 [Campylobacter majalis]|uniref:Uncharacterized protein n=1 Tax=Campylobacter majalis TaxID=2790656 RepID=A0ABM8Q726_9BACT|nr:hypothetical protein [Campylobacter majalis]CAD7288594.1 hypothetical protein LMG7974_01066 [Campylobacter majalis]